MSELKSSEEPAAATAPTQSPKSPNAPTSPASDKSRSRSPLEAGPGGILPASHWAQAADDNDDAESAVGSDAGSSTASVASSILQYRNIKGRTYHSEQGNAEYWGSNDERQSESMDINHHTLTLACDDQLFKAPLETDKLQNVLDVGTGTGIWAIDFADEFPHVQVTGTDLSPIQPSWVPPNLKFEIEDCTQAWTFAPDTFDYIHMRWLVGSIKDWLALYKESFQACKPGGWVESFETSSILTSDDDTVSEESAIGQWGKFFIEGGKKLGSSFTVFEDGVQRREMEAAGFVDIGELTFKCPLGEWPKDARLKEMGRFTELGLLSDVEGFVLYMAHTLGWSQPEIQVYIAQLRREIKSGKHHAYY